jgi:hypothetical protein
LYKVNRNKMKIDIEWNSLADLKIDFILYVSLPWNYFPQ